METIGIQSDVNGSTVIVKSDVNGSTAIVKSDANGSCSLSLSPSLPLNDISSHRGGVHVTLWQIPNIISEVR